MKLTLRPEFLTAFLFSLILTIALLIPSPAEGRILGSLSDSLHTPTFALLALLICRWLFVHLGRRSLPVAWTVCFSVIAFGVLAEFGQHFVGRTFSFKDMAANSLGAVAGTIWAFTSKQTSTSLRRRRRALAVALLVVGISPAMVNLTDAIIQQYDFPVLASFEQPLERFRWRSEQCRLTRVRGHATDGDWSLQVDLLPSKSSGITTLKLPANWSGYKELAFNVELDQGKPIDWLVSIADRKTHDKDNGHFKKTFHLTPGPQKIVIPLDEIAQEAKVESLDLHKITYLRMFTSHLDNPRTIFLDNLRLR